MKKTLILLSLLFLVLLAAFAAWQFLAPQQNVTAAPEVFQSGISAGCYIAAPNACKIHVDPFTINVDDGNNEKLVEFQIVANEMVNQNVVNQTVIYHFKTDSISTNIPAGDYAPSLVMQDFAVTCGLAYAVELRARDEGDASLLIAGTTGTFTCPSTVP